LLSWYCTKTSVQNEVDVNVDKCSLLSQKGLFGMVVAGDAMVSITNIGTSICHGGIAIIDKNRSYACGDIVLVKIKDVIKIRQLTKDGTEEVLKPFNLQYPVIPFTQDIKILGVVIELRNKIKTTLIKTRN